MWNESCPQNHNGATPCLPSHKAGNAHFKKSFVVLSQVSRRFLSVIEAKGGRCSFCYKRKEWFNMTLLFFIYFFALHNNLG